MSTKDRFNADIELIENVVRWNTEIKSRDIAEDIAQQNGLQYHDMNTIFTYLVGCSLVDYIKERRMMSSYQEAISSSQLESETLCTLAGCDSQSAFIRKFKERFDMTLNEAFTQKDETKLTQPRTWEMISQESRLEKSIPIASDRPDIKFGIDIGLYERMMEAANLQELYEFNDIQSEVAFELSLKHKFLSMKMIFDFIDDYTIHKCLNANDEFNLSLDDFRQLIESEDALFVLCMKHNLMKLQKARYMPRNRLHFARRISLVNWNLLRVMDRSITPLRTRRIIFSMLLINGMNGQRKPLISASSKRFWKDSWLRFERRRRNENRICASSLIASRLRPFPD